MSFTSVEAFMQKKLFNAYRLIILAGITASFARPSTYNFTSFDGPGQNGGGTTVNGINNNGYIVGFSTNNAANPTLFTNFVLNPLDTLSELNINNDPLAMANGINNSNTIVGASNNQAFQQAGSQFTALPPISGTSAMQTAFGINDHGVIVGQFTDGATDTQPGFVYNGTSYTILNPVASVAVVNAQSVNNQGEVAGFYSTNGVNQHGFLFNDISGTYQLLPDPNVANLVLTQFLGINDNGLAVGYYQTNDGSQHGFIYNIATNTYSFLDDPNAALNGFSVTQITGINDSGEIAGFYVDPNTGLQRGFYATSAVPEPSTLVLFTTAFLALMLLRRSHAKFRGSRLRVPPQ
jgi:hypothetical protein